MQSLPRCKKERCERGKRNVHGDLREPNIMYREVDSRFEVMFIDFDWSGPYKQAMYPHDDLNKDIIRNDKLSLYIQMRDDIDTVANTLKKYCFEFVEEAQPAPV